MSSYVAALPGEETLIECWSALTQLSPGAQVIKLPVAVAAVFPSWAPLNNVILRVDPSDLATGNAISQLTARYAEAGVETWALWLPSRRADLDVSDSGSWGAAGLALSGLQRDTTTLVMQLDLSSWLQLHDGVVRTSIATATRATDEPVRRADLDPPDDVPGLEGWVMLHGNVAIAGAWSYLNRRDCAIYAVGTQPGWRRRGFARALTEHVLAEAWRRGARTASLQSTRMGQPLYASLGFRAVGRYEEWIWVAHKSTTTASVGFALQINTFPSAGGSSGSGS